MLETAGYTNFSWRDLHAPTAKRLRYQLSAIINLAKFRDDFIWVLEGLNEQVRNVDMCVIVRLFLCTVGAVMFCAMECALQPSNSIYFTLCL